MKKHTDISVVNMNVVCIPLGYSFGVPLLCLHIMVTVATRILMATQANLLSNWSIEKNQN